MPYAIGFVVIALLFSFINLNTAFALLNVSILYRFQDRYDLGFPIFLLLVVCLLIGLFLNRDKLSTKVFAQDKYIIYLLVFSVVGLLIMEPSAVMSETREYISSLFFYYLATRLVTDVNRLKVHILAISIITMYLGFEAYQSTLLDPESMFWTRDGKGKIIEERRLQGMGYYNNPNEFGSLMLWPIPLLFAYFLNTKSKIIKIIVVLGISFLIFIMFKSLSRTVMATFFIMLMMWALLSTGDGRIVKKVITGTISGLVIIVVLSYLPGPIANRINSITNFENDSSFQGRTRSWDQGLQMVSWYPIFGVGKGQWVNYHGLMPHNTYIQVLAEMAFIGLYFFLRIIYLNYRSLLHCLYECGVDVQTRRFMIAIIVTLSGYLIYIFFGNQAYAPWTYFYLGLGASCINFIKKDEELK